MKRVVGVCVILLLLWPAFAGAETVVVKVLKASIKASRSVQATTIAEARRGEKLEVVKKEGSWYMVRLPNYRTGWVFEYSVSPVEETSKEEDLFGELEEKSRIQVSEATSASSIRGLSGPTQGLSKPTRVYADNHSLDKLYVQAVEKMDAYSVTQEEVDLFLRQGQVEGR